MNSDLLEDCRRNQPIQPIPNTFQTGQHQLTSSQSAATKTKPENYPGKTSNDEIIRYARLYTKLRQLFRKNTPTLLVPNPTEPRPLSHFSSPTSGSSQIHIFVDLSNVYIGFCQCLQHYLDHFPSAYSNDDSISRRYLLHAEISRILAKHPSAKYVHDMDLTALNLILQRGRRVSSKSISGSLPSEQSGQGKKNTSSTSTSTSSNSCGSGSGLSHGSRKKDSSMKEVYSELFGQARNLGYNATVMPRISTNPNNSKCNNKNIDTSSESEDKSDESKHEDDDYRASHDKRLFIPKSNSLKPSLHKPSNSKPSKHKAFNPSQQHKEHGVDEILTFQILQTIMQHSPAPPTPSSFSSSSALPTGTIVLVTGDGQPSQFSSSNPLNVQPSTSTTSNSTTTNTSSNCNINTSSSSSSANHPLSVSRLGFYSAIEKALHHNWNVELFSFGKSLSSNWSRLASKTSLDQSRFRIVYLDEFVFEMGNGRLTELLNQWVNDDESH